MAIQFKTGQPRDCNTIAKWINSIGHGHIEYLLENLVPYRSALQHLALVLNEDPDYSYKNVDLAVNEDSMIGIVFSYSAHSNVLKPEMERVLTKDRILWLRYFSENQIDNSWYINTLGVANEYRRRGIAKQLLDFAAKRALQNKFQCLSLHVYKNNTQAIKLYESYGFTKVKVIDLTAHSFFTSRNLSASILMKCELMKT